MKSTVTLTSEALSPVIAFPTNWQRILLLIILGYEAAGGLTGGILLILRPDGKLMEMPVDIMHGTFSDFLIPGIILLGMGILTSFAFVSVLRRSLNDWLMGGLALGGFVIWFIVEIIILKELHWLHLMWGLPVLLGWLLLIPLIALRNPSAKTQNTLIGCGLMSSLWYLAINIFVPTQYEGYSIASYTVSELSAIGSPTRLLWVLLAIFYPLLFSAFGWSIFVSSKNKLLRIVGALIIIYCVFNLYWPPMHMRGAQPTLTDTLHIVWAVLTNVFMWLFMGFGAAAMNKPFRIYTIASIVLHIIFGALTFVEAPNISTDGPTPTIGIWERINIAVFMIWVAVFAIALLREKRLIDNVAPAVK